MQLITKISNIHSFLGDTQGVTKPTVSRAVHEVVDFFVANQQLFIQWPKDFIERL